MKTLRVLARFGPKLPAMVEAQLIRAGNPANPVKPPRQELAWRWWPLPAVFVALAAGVALARFL